MSGMVSVGTVNNPANIFAFSIIITKRPKKKVCHYEYY